MAPGSNCQLFVTEEQFMVAWWLWGKTQTRARWKDSQLKNFISKDKFHNALKTLEALDVVALSPAGLYSLTPEARILMSKNGISKLNKWRD